MLIGPAARKPDIADLPIFKQEECPQSLSVVVRMTVNPSVAPRTFKAVLRHDFCCFERVGADRNTAQDLLSHGRSAFGERIAEILFHGKSILEPALVEGMRADQHPSLNGLLPTAQRNVNNC